MERKQGVSKYRALRRKLGDKRDEDNFEWSKLHSEELNDLQCSPKI